MFYFIQSILFRPEVFMSFWLVSRFRQYGLWERYAELYPNEDVVYTVGDSDYRTDWFFAQVTKYGSNSFRRCILH